MDVVLASIVGFLLGGIVALFLDKAYSGTPLRGRVRACTNCGRPAGVLDAFPVIPALLAGGRCRACGARAPRRLWVLPPAGALVLAAAWLTGEGIGDRALGSAFGLVFLTLMATDLERRLLPNRLIYPSLLIAVLVSLWWPGHSAGDALLGAAVGFAFMLGPYLVMPGGLGAGDVKLAALMGAVLGFPEVLVGLGAGILGGGVAAALILTVRRGGRKATMAYGPYLAAGALAALWWGGAFLDWYTGG